MADNKVNSGLLEFSEDQKVNSGLLEFSEDQKVFVALDAETSEVKKAVTIDGDGVETDIQGVQPSGKKEITSTAEVNVANYATAQVVDADLVAGNIKKDVDILGVVGSYEAPASDFSIVNVTFNRLTPDPNGGGSWSEICCVTEEDNSLIWYSDWDSINQNPVKVALYKGHAIGTASGDDFAVSGSATWDSDTYVLDITGDCTITYTPSQDY